MMNWAATPQDCQRGDRKDAKGGFTVSANGDELAESASVASVKLRHLAKVLPVATLLASTGSPHRLTAPRYGLSSYCGRSLFIADAMP